MRIHVIDSTSSRDKIIFNAEFSVVNLNGETYLAGRQPRFLLLYIMALQGQLGKSFKKVQTITNVVFSTSHQVFLTTEITKEATEECTV